MKYAIICQLFCVIFFFNGSNLISDTIYNWIDENGVKNFSNSPANVPSNFFENKRANFQIHGNANSLSAAKRVFKVEDENEQEKEYFVRLKKQRERQILIEKIKELAKREYYLEEQLVVKKDSAVKTKREFDKLIMDGYFADHSILELKRLEREMTGIDWELESIKPRKQKLVALAIKSGISKRYFRN